MSDDTNAAPTLQFDTAVPAGATGAAGTAHGVSCAACQQAIADEYFDVNGQSMCGRCRDQAAELATAPKGFGVFGRAALFGFGAMVLGAILYYAVIAISGYEIGLVAIAIGYMVGYAVSSATGGRGGRRFQILALFLTYWAVGLAYTPLLIREMGKNQEAPAISKSADTATADAASTNTPMTGTDVMIGIGAALALTLALPLLSVFGSLPGGLISAAIIAFGMHQSWRMTGAPQVVITGPFRVAPTPASP